MIFLGFDTSNYTTSIAALGSCGVKNIRSVLPVEEGKRGIRQSEGVFLHTKSIAELYKKLDIDFNDVCAVGVSVRPRSVDGSYMPVFLVGEAFAQGVAHTLGVPLMRFSHQDGHIMAGVFSGSNEALMQGDFLSLHLSGGTTEILRTHFNGNGFDNEIIGATKDISAGQFIDRTGVYLGMKFPCGKELDALSLKTQDTIKLPICTDGAYMNFSGVETKIKGLIGSENDAVIARSVIENIRDTLIKAINSAIEKTRIKKVLAVGGVMSNSLIRKGLEENINGRLYLASPEFSSDNAAGTAALSEYIFKKGKDLSWSQKP